MGWAENFVHIKITSSFAKQESSFSAIHIDQEEIPITPANIPTSASPFLLSGASGMLGTALLQELLQRNTPTLQLVRSIRPNGSSQIVWDPAAAVPVEHPSQIEGCRAAIHLSGANVGAQRWTSAYKREMTESRVRTTRALAETLANLKNPPQTILVASAVGIYGDRGDEILDETSSQGSGFLAGLCRQWEQAAEPARAAGIRVVHLRLGVILGPHGGALQKVLPLFRLGLGGPLGNGRQWMSWISLADAVRAIFFAVESPQINGPLNLVSPSPVTNAEFTRKLAHCLHRPAFFRAPAFALRLALGQMADEALLASARVLPAKLTNAGFQYALPALEETLHAAL
ncbi:MAG: TIGR01777 family oxidoreductase [Terracidiphilus sp.]|nr:TIGR01777 family oxidoreductase [Terracidiphilus sp.]